MTDYSNKHFLAGLREQLFADLSKNGIKISGDPFPEKKTPYNGMYYDKDKVVMGFSLRETAEANNRSTAPCRNNSVNDRFLDIDRMRVGLHETSHAIIYQQSLVKPIIDAMARGMDPQQRALIPAAEQTKADTIMQMNVDESLADSIAAQYMLKRFGADKRIPAYIEAMQALREAPIQDITHQTQPLVSKVYNKWRGDRSIVPHYQLTDAARDVVKMISSDQDAQTLGRDIAKKIVFAPGFRRWMNEDDQRANRPLTHGDETMFNAYIGKSGNTPTPEDRLTKRQADKNLALKILCQSSH